MWLGVLVTSFFKQACSRQDLQIKRFHMATYWVSSARELRECRHFWKIWRGETYKYVATLDKESESHRFFTQQLLLTGLSEGWSFSASSFWFSSIFKKLFTSTLEKNINPDMRWTFIFVFSCISKTLCLGFFGSTWLHLNFSHSLWNVAVGVEMPEASRQVTFITGSPVLAT